MKLKTNNFLRSSRELRSQGKLLPHVLVRSIGGYRESQPTRDEAQGQKFCRKRHQSRETETVLVNCWKLRVDKFETKTPGVRS